MKITKRQLKRIIKEERTKLLKEFGSMDKEIMNPLVQFAQDWSGLGDAVQSQIIDVVNGYIENRVEAVYEVNPNALDTAKRKLSRSLRMLTDDDGQEILEALEWAEGIFREGDEEVERDARAAGDR